MDMFYCWNSLFRITENISDWQIRRITFENQRNGCQPSLARNSRSLESFFKCHLSRGKREGHLQKRKINKQTNTFDTFVLHRKRKRKWTLENRRKNNNSNWKRNNEREYLHLRHV